MNAIRNLGKLIDWLRVRTSGWMHLIVFIVILSIASYIKYLSSRIDWVVPPLAAWEIAALVHVFLVAQKLMQFRGFEFASRKFNSRVKRLVLNVIGLLILVKLVAIFFETKVLDGGEGLVPLLSLPRKAEGFQNVVHAVAPYILMIPLFFFFIVNCLAQFHVRCQSRSLGIEDTNQEKYLSGLIRFVDAPVVLPYLVMIVYLKGVDRIFDAAITEDLVVGVIGCCLLIVSNLLTGVFDDHWSNVKND